MGEVFIGSDAVAAGALTEYELRRWYRPIFRDVYVPKRRWMIAFWAPGYGRAGAR